MNSETYNMLALGGLLLGKLILLSILICYCCKTRRKNLAAGTEVVDSADQTDVTGAHLEAEKQLRKQVEEMDKPPKYNSVVLREDPPEYMESVINAQINPEINRQWAEHLDKGEVDREIELIICRSRENSIVSQLKETRCAFNVDFDVESGPDTLSPTRTDRATARGRRNTLANISELPHRGGSVNRTRTTSYSAQVCTLWIGH